jgi:hypothetical protein
MGSEQYSGPLVSMGMWFPGDRHWGKPWRAQDAQSSVVYCGCLIHFSHNIGQLLLKTCHLSTNLKFSLGHFTKAHSLLPCFGGTICFWRGRFHKIKGRETLSRSLSDLNPLMMMQDWLRASVLQLSCVMYVWAFKILVLEISFDF